MVGSEQPNRVDILVHRVQTGVTTQQKIAAQIKAGFGFSLAPGFTLTPSF
jgi:hypothetical protein